MFALQVQWNKQHGTLKFNDGELTGPADFLRYVKLHLNYVKSFGPPCCQKWPRKEVLTNAIPCYLFLQQVFQQDGLIVEGTAPTFDTEIAPS